MKGSQVKRKKKSFRQMRIFSEKQGINYWFKRN